MRKRTRGQALVEFALTMPLFMLLVFVTIELSLVFVSYYSQTRMARETGRWLAVHSAVTNDAELAAHVQSTMLVGVNTLLPTTISGPPTLITTGTATIPAKYQIGTGTDVSGNRLGMTVEFTPCLPSGDTTNPSGTGVCTEADRVAGATLYVQMSYNVRPVLFLPTTFRLGPLSTSLPTGLPVYKVSTMVE